MLFSAILAQAAPSSAALANFASVVEVAAWIAVTISAIIFGWKQVTGKSEETRIGGQPLEVKSHVTYATAQQHAALEKQTSEKHAELLQKMDSELGRERGARKLMHQEIATLQSGVEVVRNQNVQQTAALGEIRRDQQAIKSEIKQDNTAMHNRIGEILTGLGEIKGRIAKL